MPLKFDLEGALAEPASGLKFDIELALSPSVGRTPPQDQPLESDLAGIVQPRQELRQKPIGERIAGMRPAPAEIRNSPSTIYKADNPVLNAALGVPRAFVHGAEQAIQAGAGFTGNEQARKASERRVQGLMLESDLPDLEQGAGSMLAIAPAGLINPAFGAVVGGGLAAGPAIGEGMEAGLSTPEAIAYGVGQGGLEYLTERIPLGILFGKGGAHVAERLVKAFFPEATGEQIATLTQDALRQSVIEPNKPWSEYWAERGEAAKKTLIATAGGLGAAGAIQAGVQRLVPQTNQFADVLDEVVRGTTLKPVGLDIVQDLYDQGRTRFANVPVQPQPELNVPGSASTLAQQPIQAAPLTAQGQATMPDEYVGPGGYAIPQGEADALQEQIPAEVDVREQARDGEEVAIGDAEVQAPAEEGRPQEVAFDVSGRTDEQLAWLAEHGKPGWKEAAIAESARRKTASLPAESAAPKFLDALSSLGNYDAQSKTLTKDGVTIQFATPNQGKVAIFDFNSGDKGRGNGARVLKEITSLADATGVDLELSATPIDEMGYAVTEPASVQRLVDFYRRNGFVSRPGTSTFMDRKPNTGAPLATQPSQPAQKESQAQGAEGKTVEVGQQANTKPAEVNAFDQRYPNIKEAEKAIKDRGLKQVAVFKDGDQYRIGAKVSNKQAPSNNLIQRIKQLGGIHTRYRADVIGDKAGAPGLFSNTGKGLDDLATALQAEGFAIDTAEAGGGVDALTGLIQRAVNSGETVLNYAGQQAAAEKKLADDYRDQLKEEIAKLGGNPARNATTKQLIEMRENLRAVAQQKTIEAAAQIETLIGKELTDADWDAILNAPLPSVDQYAADLDQAAFMQREQEENDAAYRRNEEETQVAAGQAATRGARQGAETGRAEPGNQEAQESREDFGLTGETPEEIRAREEAQAAKEKAESDRAKADEQPFVMTGSNRAADELAARGQTPMFSKAHVETEAFKRWSNNAPLVTSEQADTYTFKTGERVVVEAFHGTKRPDRVGTKFLKRRATSGPMAFFTSDPTLASGYAQGKSDTSLAMEDQHYATWFKWKPPGSRSKVDIVRAWYFLDGETKQKIREIAPTLRMDDDGNVVSEEGNKTGNGSYDYNLEESARKSYARQGNPLEALVEDWLNSGNLFNDEETFLDVLSKIGFPKDVEYDSPFAEYPFVYKTYIEMQSPLVTTDVPQSVKDALNGAAKRDRTRPKPIGADTWDKTLHTLREWVEIFNSDDNTYVWTSIPDKVTDVLRGLGYDGIIDKSGKGGGAVHPVYIPFEESQVKSAIGNKGKYDTGKNDILKGVGMPTGKGMTVESATANLRKRFGKRIDKMLESSTLKIVATPAQLPAWGKGQRGIGGAWDGTTAWIVASQASPETLAATYLHEVGEHAGMQEMLGNKYHDVITRLDDLIWDGDETANRAASRVPKDTPAKDVQHERLAYFIEEAQRARDAQPQTFSTKARQLLQDILAAIRAWAYRKFGGITLTEADILALARQSAKQVADRAGQAQGQTAAEAMLQKVWHGTPHIWAPEPGFPHGRPRLDKMGTGEGVQAYGWGWYSAEDEGVGRSYRDNLSSAIHHNAGSLYQLDIPDDVLPYLLDWNKPLSEQTPEVRDALKRGGSIAKANPRMSGREIYESVARNAPDAFGLNGKSAQQVASEYLASIGIVGNRYLDGQSRNRPLKDIKREFLAELPEDADAGEVAELIGTGKFSPKNDALLRALRDDDWLGFDYPAQAVSAALGKDLGNYDASPELIRAVEDAKEGGTYNFVIWDQPTLDKIALLERNGEKLDAMREAEVQMSRTGTINITRSAQRDMFQEDMIGPDATVETSRLASSKGDTELGVNVNSTGRQIAPTRQALENFWKWFGNSETVDDEGRPSLYYHTTLNDFEQFEANRVTANSGTFGDWETSRAAIFFTESLDDSQAYGRSGDGFAAGANVMPVYIRAENILDMSGGYLPSFGRDAFAIEEAGLNPRYMEQFDWSKFDDEDGRHMVDALKRAGYDGIKFWDENPHTRESFLALAVFDPGQIKSALGNRGTFDPANPDIRFSKEPQSTDAEEMAKKFGFAIKGMADARIQPSAERAYIENQEMFERMKRGVVSNADSKAAGEALAAEVGWSPDSVDAFMKEAAQKGTPPVDILAAMFAMSRMQSIKLLEAQNPTQFIEYTMDVLRTLMATRAYGSEMGRALQFIGAMERMGGYTAADVTGEGGSLPRGQIDAPGASTIAIDKDVSRQAADLAKEVVETGEFNETLRKTADAKMSEAEMEAEVKQLEADLAKADKALSDARKAREAARQRRTEARQSLKHANDLTKSAQESTAKHQANTVPAADIKAAEDAMRAAQAEREKAWAALVKARQTLMKAKKMREKAQGQTQTMTGKAQAAKQKTISNIAAALTEENLRNALGGDKGIQKIMAAMHKQGKDVDLGMLVSYLSGMVDSIAKEQSENRSTLNKLMAMHVELWRANILTGLFTHEVNVTSNAANMLIEFGLVNPIQEMLPGGIGLGGYLDALKSMGGYRKVLADIWALMKYSAFEEAPASRLSHLLDQRDPELLALMRGTEGSKWADTHRKFIPGLAGKVVRGAGFVPLGIEDAIFKVIPFRYELARQQAAGEQRNVTAAIDAANKLTFQDSTGMLGMVVAKMHEKAPYSEFWITFVKTMTNLIKRSFDLTPGLSQAKNWDALIGKEGDKARREAIALSIVGVGIASMVMALMGDDDDEVQLSGFAPYDRLKKLLWLEEHDNIGLRIGDEVYPFYRMSPLAEPAGLTIGAYNSIKQGDAGPLFNAMYQSIVTKHFMAKIADLIDGIEEVARAEGNEKSEAGERLVRRQLGGIATGTMIPNFIAQLGDMTDAEKREVNTIMQDLQKKIPVLRESLPSKLKVTGEVMGEPRYMSPFPVQGRPVKKDEVTRWLLKLGRGIDPNPKSIKDLPHDVRQTLLRERWEFLGYAYEASKDLDAETQEKIIRKMLSAWAENAKAARVMHELETPAD